MAAQALLDLATCVVVALLAARLAPVSRRAMVGTAALWMAALCPFTADYTAVVLTEALATFFTAGAAPGVVFFVAGAGVGLAGAWGDRLVGAGKSVFVRRLVLAAGNYSGDGNLGAAGDASGFGRSGDCAVRALVAAGGLGEVDPGDVLDVRWAAVTASAVGGAECARVRTRGISGAALAADLWRFYSARLFCLAADVDDAIWPSLSGDLEAGEAAG